MPKLPTSHNRTLTGTTTAKDRVDGLAKPDDDTLAEVDTTRPLQMRGGEHGHIDGPRGLQDFHTHDDGDKEHGHKRGPLLGRTAAVDEYVPPLAATVPPGADQTTGPTPAGVPDVVAASEPGGDAGSDAAGSGRSTALELADAVDGSAPLEQRLAATERKIRARLKELEIVTELHQLAGAAAHQLDYDDLVAAEVIRQVKATIDRWAQGRGVRVP
jgi:hypothetical protein